MSRTYTHPTEKIIAALRETKGLVYLAAKRVGCDPDTIYRRAKRYPKVAAVIKNQRGEIVDTAELTLYNAILNGEAWATTFTLKTLGKDRGYYERSEVDLRAEVRQRVIEEVEDVPNVPGSGREGSEAPPGTTGVPVQ